MSEAPVPEISVEPDHFDVVNSDVVLVARLESTFALCLYDAVLESGALIHLRVAPPGRVQDPNLTDTTLSTDLLLLDRCFVELRKMEPRAQHWQAKVVGQVQNLPGARERFDGIQSFLSAFLVDANVKLVSCDTHVDHVQLLKFRPAMDMFAANLLPLSASVAENRRHAPKNSCLAGPPRGVAHRRCRVGRQEGRQRTSAQAV